MELIDTGVALYLVDSIYGDVGGTAFTVNLVPGQYFLELVDPSAVPFGLPAYVPVLVEFGGDTTIAPFYLTATPELTADAPVPTEFSDYFGLFIGAVLFSTDSGDLIFFADDADPNFATSITAVPEPSTLTIACLGSLAGLLAFRRARRTQVAA
ncbi:MAG: PEP-CTERM sorting domain-containing protein [Planctomycetes bacterium]|nr:PEP-CTERM sorting domain-containing protein [Planctomycetota bacterium]